MMSHRALDVQTCCWPSKAISLCGSSVISRYKVAITKHKDLEQFSSSLYNQNNIWNPAVDFSKYIEDNENIEDEVCWDGMCMWKIIKRL